VARNATGAPLPLAGAPVAELSDLSGAWSALAELRQESPTRYAAELDLPAAVREVVAVACESRGGPELARAELPVPFPAELARVGPDRGALEELARLAGGEVISSPAELVRMDFAEARGRGLAAGAPWLALAGLVLVLAELALRTIKR